MASWPDVGDCELDVLIAGRGLILANTVLAAHDPAIRAEASHYIPLIGERLKRWLAC